MIKVLLAFGTRPEAIKMAPLVSCLKQDANFDVKVMVTAQHRQMLDQVLEVFDLIPDYDLDVMSQNQTLAMSASKILLGTEQVLKEFQPDLVLVHGDTLSAFVVAQSAFYQQINIGHVEAGLRTYDLSSPWPEEGNRQLISRIATLHFAPTQRSYEALVAEGIQVTQIEITGNTVIDALMQIQSRDLPLPKGIHGEDLIFSQSRKKILITGHRRENFGEGFKNICLAIQELAEKYRDIDFIYPVHLNPNVKNTVSEYLDQIENVYLIPPQGYEEFIYLMKHSFIILTDSGGIQEEAPGLGIPVLVMRNTTERQEAVDAGTVKLVGVTKNNIVDSVSRLVEQPKQYQAMQESVNPYGIGDASQRIKMKILDFYNHHKH
jgi:UDP-N-acetylglucosamine 2-epimerase (non-hydrolysing)